MRSAEFDFSAFAEWLVAIELGNWADTLEFLLKKRFSPSAHGDYHKWKTALRELPAAASDPPALEEILQSLSPWRKGPFDVGGVKIDAEWQSDWKWRRLAPAIESLDGRRVLDVGCGNGYYALQMRSEGATAVLGIDASLLYVMQFLAINYFEKAQNVFVLPIRLNELLTPVPGFDTTFSMGVLYHQRSPIDHLRQLRETLRRGGQLVLETIFVPGDESYACTPEDRYARMKNVWLLPTLAELRIWLSRSGFKNVEIIDTTITTTQEQRTTKWMRFESLTEALDPNDASRTVEGWPAPRRVIVTATAP